MSEAMAGKDQADPPAPQIRTRSRGGADEVDELLAAQRLLCRAQAGLLSAVRRLSTSGTYSPCRTRAGRIVPHGFCAVEIASALTLSQYAAEQLVEVADLAVETCPALMRDLSEGTLDLAKLKMLRQELDGVDPGLVPAVVDALRPEFGRCTAGQLRERLRYLILQVDPEAAQKRHDVSVARRRLRHSEFAGGTAALTLSYVPAVRAAAAWNNVDRIAHATKAAGDPDRRSLDQIRADVCADLLAGVDPSGVSALSQVRGTVNLGIDLTTLACLNDDPGLVPGFGPVLADIARQTVRQIGEAAQWRFAVTADGVTIAEGRLRYRPTPTQRAFVATRDGTCRAPGCRRPALRCQIDHVIDRAKAGITTVGNLCSLCELHHQAKHAGGFRIRRVPRGIEWTTPFGRRYLVLPAGAPAPAGRLGPTSARRRAPTQLRR